MERPNLVVSVNYKGISCGATAAGYLNVKHGQPVSLFVDDDGLITCITHGALGGYKVDLSNKKVRIYAKRFVNQGGLFGNYHIIRYNDGNYAGFKLIRT